MNPLRPKLAQTKLMGLVVFELWLLITSQMSVGAQTIDVSAQVLAPLPSQPAIITSPQNLSHVTTAELTVAGTCSADTAFVSIDRNNDFAGITACASGTFSLTLTLVPGNNQLVSHSINSTNNEGPIAEPVTVFYDVPLPPSPPFIPLVLPTPTPIDDRFYLTLDQPNGLSTPGKELTWQVAIHGGRPLYTLTVTWGDGTSVTEYEYSTAHTLKHTYAKSGYYFVILDAGDSSGKAATLTFLVITKDGPQKTTDTPPAPGQTNPWTTPATIATATGLGAAVVFGPRLITRVIARIVSSIKSGGKA